MAMNAQPFDGPGDRPPTPARAPSFVSLFNPIGRRLAGAGLMGPNALLTVRGRKSGLSRTTPVAFVEVDGRRWIIATFGDVNWARNLRAAGEASITIKRRAEPVRATEPYPGGGTRFSPAALTPLVQRVACGRLRRR